MKYLHTMCLLTAMSIPCIASAQDGNAKTGAQVYYDYGCYGCHGFSGYGRKDLNNTGSPMLINADVFVAFLRGRADVAPIFPVTDMPNYPANSLSDTQARDLYAYIRSMPVDTAEIGDVPVLRAILEAAERRTYQP